MIGYRVKTLLTVHSVVDLLDVGFEKEFLIVAAQELDVKQFFDSRSDTFGIVQKIEDKGPILVLL